MKVIKKIGNIIVAAGAFGILLVGASARVETAFAAPELSKPYETVYEFTNSRNHSGLTVEEAFENSGIEVPADEPELVSLGTYKISAYCPCEKCCLKSDGITASGVKATPNRTVAVDGIPFGTRLLIDGNEYVVEDRVGSGKRLIDVFFPTHDDALNSGLWYNTEVYEIIEE